MVLEIPHFKKQPYPTLNAIFHTNVHSVFFGRMMNNPYLTIPGWKLSVLSPGLSKHACHSPFWKRLKSPFLMFECHNFMVQSAVWISYFSQNYSWLVVSTYPSEKYDFVSWDDDISNMVEQKMFQTTNQYIIGITYWRIVMSLRNVFQNSNMGLFNMIRPSNIEILTSNNRDLNSEYGYNMSIATLSGK